MQEPRTISFEVPGDVARTIFNPLATEDQKLKAQTALFIASSVAIQDAMKRPDLAEFEINTSVKPWGLDISDIQEGAEELDERTRLKLPKSAVTDLMKRDVCRFKINVMAKRKMRLFAKERDTLGPMEGFQAYDDLPDVLAKEIDPAYAAKRELQ
jgi:hypothetical protein